MRKWPIETCSVGEAERAAGSLDLTVTMRGTLAKHPGCAHWHLKRKGAKGVVEVTLWDGGSFVSVQDGRSSPEVLELAGSLAKLLSG